jgi:hypothetical protein
MASSASLAKLSPGSSAHAISAGVAAFHYNQLVYIYTNKIYSIKKSSCFGNKVNAAGAPRDFKLRTLHLSSYIAIYDVVVPKDMLRQMNELIDFSFILEK